MSNFEPPYRRYAIRCLHRGDGHESWFTDDGTGGDEAIDYTAWDEERAEVERLRGAIERRVGSAPEPWFWPPSRRVSTP